MEGKSSLSHSFSFTFAQSLTRSNDLSDLHNVGGIPALLKYILKETDLIDGTQLTVTGLSLAENVADAPDLDFAAQVRASLSLFCAHRDVNRPLILTSLGRHSASQQPNQDDWPLDYFEGESRADFRGGENYWEGGYCFQGYCYVL